MAVNVKKNGVQAQVCHIFGNCIYGLSELFFIIRQIFPVKKGKPYPPQLLFRLCFFFAGNTGEKNKGK